jgi:hypothetical protein
VEIHALKEQFERLNVTVNQLQEATDAIIAKQLVDRNHEMVKQLDCNESRKKSEPFVTVKKHKKAPKQLREINHPLVLRNKYALLAEGDETKNLVTEAKCEITKRVLPLVIGDYTSAIMPRNKNLRRKEILHRCYPGLKIEDVVTKVNTDAVEYSGDDPLIIMVGANNANQSEKTEDILKKYESMIKLLKPKFSNVNLIGMLPQIHQSNHRLNRMLRINDRLKNICKSSNVGFVDLREMFSEPSLQTLSKNSPLLNDKGQRRLFSLLCEEGLLRTVDIEEENTGTDFSIEQDNNMKSNSEKTSDETNSSLNITGINVSRANSGQSNGQLKTTGQCAANAIVNMTNMTPNYCTAIESSYILSQESLKTIVDDKLRNFKNTFVIQPQNLDFQQTMGSGMIT